jgi:tetratricopeptide (TPR) repeat protein
MATTQAVNPSSVGILSHANLASNAFFTPQMSRFIREILEKALTNPIGVAPRWLAEAWALLANLLVNDYLNSWNHAGKEELNKAEDAAENALALNRQLPLAHHARGLAHRARGEHAEALGAFTRAVDLDPNFARALAQKANEWILLGAPRKAVPRVAKAIQLSPRDPASATFYWIEGRAHFYAGDYSGAIPPLRRSVEIQSNLWYSWAYLVSAHALSPNQQDNNEATNVLQQFTGLPQFRGITLADVEEFEEANPDSNAVVVQARQNLHNGLIAAGLRAR